MNQPAVNILNTWKGEIYQNIRARHLSENYNSLCRNCEGWTTAHWKLSYEQAIRTIGGMNE